MSYKIKYFKHPRLSPSNGISLTFENKLDRYDYFEKFVLEGTSFQDVKYSYDDTVKIGMPYEQAIEMNYVGIRKDGSVNIEEGWQYFYVVDVQYISEEVSRIELIRDDLLTYQFDYELEESFVVREHQDRWKYFITDEDTEDEEIHYKPIYNIQDDNLPNGELKKTTYNFQEPDGFGNVSWIVIKTTEPIGVEEFYDYNGNFRDTTAEPGLVAEISLRENLGKTPYFIYAYPISGDIDNNNIVFLKPDTNNYISSYRGNPLELIPSSKRSKILSIQQYNVDPFNIVWANFEEPEIVSFQDGVRLFTNNNMFYFHIYDKGNLNVGKASVELLQNENDIINIYNPSVDKLQPKDINCETKLHTYPYNYIGLPNGGFIIKNEYLNEPLKLNYFRSLDPSAKGVMTINNYQLGSENSSNNTFLIDTPVDLPVVEPNLNVYLREKAGSIDAARKNNEAKFKAEQRKTGTGLLGGIFGLKSSAFKGGVKDVDEGKTKLRFALSGKGRKAGIDAQAARNATTRELQGAQTDASASADKVLSSSLGIELANYQFSIGNEVYERVEQLDEFKKRSYDVLYRTGVPSNEWKIPNLKSRYYFNYIQMSEVYFNSLLNDDIIASIRSRYDSGVRLHHIHRDELNNFEDENFSMTYENFERSLELDE